MNQASLFDITHEDTILTFSSLYWISGVIILISSTLNGGCRIVTTEKFTPESMLTIIEEHKVTFFVSASHYLVLSSRCEKFFQTNLSSIRKFLCAGSKLSTAVACNVLQYLKNGEICSCYGMSEIAGVISIGTVKQVSDESSGNITPGLQVKVVDDNGDRLGVNEMGEICVKYKYEFIGYYKNEEATKNSMDNEGFLLTGDVGYFDENGNLYVIDRKKEMLKYCSSQISPTEIEFFLLKHDCIKVACVVGIPDPIAGELPAALIILHENAEISAEEIEEIVAGNYSIKGLVTSGVELMCDFFTFFIFKIILRITSA